MKLNIEDVSGDKNSLSGYDKFEVWLEIKMQSHNVELQVG